MNKPLLSVICLSIFFGLLVQPVFCAEKSSRYVTLRYRDKKLLNEFNDQLILTRRLAYSLRRKNPLTAREEVLAKVDLIIEKAEIVLDMFPNNMHITVVLLPSSDEVSRVYKKKYGKEVDHIAYYSLSEDTIYISVRDARLRVLAHEVGHAIVDHYFKVRPPYNIHELMAQFTEKHITD